MAAVLACGEGAVLSHRSAAALVANARRVDRGSRRRHHPRYRSREGQSAAGSVCIDRSTLSLSRLHTSRMASRSRPARTDAAGPPPRTSPRRMFASALREAEFLGPPVGDGFVTDRTRSELEAMFLDVVRRHRLPKPEVNVGRTGSRSTSSGAERRLIVEVDGWESHELDPPSRRTARGTPGLKLLGFDVLRSPGGGSKTDGRASPRAIRSSTRASRRTPECRALRLHPETTKASRSATRGRAGGSVGGRT